MNQGEIAFANMGVIPLGGSFGSIASSELVSAIANRLGTRFPLGQPFSKAESSRGD